MYFHRMRRNAVCNHHQFIMPGRHMMRHFKMSVMNRIAGGHGHGGMIEGAAEVDVRAGSPMQPDQRIISGALRIVAIGGRLREPVQLASAKLVAVTPMHDLRYVRNMGAPRRMRRSSRRVNL